MHVTRGSGRFQSGDYLIVMGMEGLRDTCRVTIPESTTAMSTCGVDFFPSIAPESLIVIYSSVASGLPIEFFAGDSLLLDTLINPIYETAGFAGRCGDCPPLPSSRVTLP